MTTVKNFEELECWQAARELTSTAYTISEKSALRNDFDLRSQFRRAALSTMNNIAEGFARYSRPDFMRFLDYSQSSASELKSMLYVLEDLGYLKERELVKLKELVEKQRALTLGLIKYLRKGKHPNKTNTQQNTNAKH